jgi:hemerythrin
MGRDERMENIAGFTRTPSSLGAVAATGVGPSMRAAWDMDAEYARLEAWLGVLRLMPECPGLRAVHPGAPVAACCDEGTRGICSEGIRALGTDMLDFMSDHFARENTLMRRGNGIRGLRELFELHTEDHGTIMSAVVKALEMPTPCAQKRAMGSLLDSHVRRHLLTHDASLREQLPRLCHEPAVASFKR